MNPARPRRVLTFRLPTLSRLRTFFAPPAELLASDPDAAALAAAFRELLVAVRHTGTPDQVNLFERRLGRALQTEVQRFLTEVSR